MKPSIRNSHTLALAALLAAGCAAPHANSDDTRSPKGSDARPIGQDGWTELFNGRDLQGWRASDFAGGGEVQVAQGRVHVKPGEPMSGITCTQKIPVTNYQLELTATRVKGHDFFAAITFPVQASHCTLVLGGWGGKLTGLSSLDDMDASQNATTTHHDFEDGRDYKIRITVQPRRIRAWLDGVSIVDADISDRTVGIRWELEPSKPLGIASYETAASYKSIRLAPLAKASIDSAKGK